MATGGFKSNATSDFLEEWKAKREKMRAKLLGDLTASASVCSGHPVAASFLGTTGKIETRNTATCVELNNNGNPERGGSAPVHCASSHPMVRSSSSSALRRPEDDAHQLPATRGPDPHGGTQKKAPQSEKVPGTPQTESGNLCHESDKDSPSPGTGSSKGKEKKSSGPSARKGKGQIERRKLREKRRSTGVVSIPSNESLDDLDDDDDNDVEKERKREEALTLLNTAQNESMASDTGSAHSLQETPRVVAGRCKSITSPDHEDDMVGVGWQRQAQAQARPGPPGLEKRIEELEKELVAERQENGRVMKASQDKDELIIKLREEIDLLYRDLDDIEDENEQLKQENKTLLKVVGQLTR